MTVKFLILLETGICAAGVSIYILKRRHVLKRTIPSIPPMHYV
ncbi:hypothetical protein [Furfurilactobacillus rossiae]|nr:hypothetical protein [Furfurilactobacillus rossiae]QLE61010.1 hypothetical protein LROSRS0_0963 [Furfurilactobacillus rossiae]